MIVIPYEQKKQYYNKTIKPVFALLPTYEDYGEEKLKLYLGGLLIEINSANNLFGGDLLDILIKLNSIYIDEKLSISKVKKQTLDCVNLLAKMAGDQYEHN